MDIQIVTKNFFHSMSVVKTKDFVKQMQQGRVGSVSILK